jgi:hypothetical protein
VGLGSEPNSSQYSDFGHDDLELLRWVVRRGSGCMWLPDSHRTRMRAMRHRIITRGPPIRQPPMRLTAVDAQFFPEDAMAEDAKRGQVERGHPPWGFSAFPTRPAAAHQAVQRKRRVVVDYRRLNAVTVRKILSSPTATRSSRPWQGVVT